MGQLINQDLFGSPTSLPWALRIADDKIPTGYALGATFHPTFLYESLWSAGLCLGLLWIDKHVQLRPGRLFALYLGGYFAGRFWIEGLRIDRAHEIAGLRLNQWVALIVVLVVTYLFVYRTRAGRDPSRRQRFDSPEPNDLSPTTVLASGRIVERDDTISTFARRSESTESCE